MTHHRLVIIATLSLLTACTGGAARGTEIGDEGSGWLCLEDTRAVTDASAEIAALGASPADLIAASTGSYTSTEAALALAAADPAELTWFDLEPQTFEDDYRPDGDPPACVDVLYVAATVALELTGLTLDTSIAGLSYADDDSVTFRAGALVHQGDLREDPDDDEGGGDEGSSYWADNSSVSTTRTPTGFTIEDMFRVELVLDGTLTDDGDWSLELWWLAESYPEGEDGTVSSYEETLWTGTVTR